MTNVNASILLGYVRLFSYQKEFSEQEPVVGLFH